MKKTFSNKTILLILTMLFFYGFTVNAQPAKFKVLVVASKANDHWRSISAGKEFFENLGAKNHFDIDFTDDASKINDANLAKYQVFVMFHLAPFDMSESQQAALQKFVKQGKGWVGVHAAGLTGKQFLGQNPTKYWDWFETLMGGVTYLPHPAFQDGMAVVKDRKHPVTKNLPEKFWISDEWYEWDKKPGDNVKILAIADKSTYEQNKPMGDYPIVWTNQDFHRMIYISIGHSPTSLVNPNYILLMRDAILWAASK